MRVALTGAFGFIGQNLRLRLSEHGRIDVVPITRDTSTADRETALTTADVVVHLAGVNRPADPADFATGNTDVTTRLCETLRASGRATPVIYASSIQAELDNPYGRSKRAAEGALLSYAADSGAGVAILRLANVFGKWCRPNYNSGVATFCHNIARDLPIVVSNPDAALRLVHIDAVTDAIVSLVSLGVAVRGIVDIAPMYDTTVGAVADMIRGFAESRRSGVIDRVGSGFVRALYATYVSYLPPDAFAYALTTHEDPRGVFAEMLRTPDAGQVSFFTAHPGITRGGHYHHSKTEKFLVVRGIARFGFRHVVTGERRDITVRGEEARVVETVPGWIHDITNVGDDEMYVLLWANEVFDPHAPDTFAARVIE